MFVNIVKSVNLFAPCALGMLRREGGKLVGEQSCNEFIYFLKLHWLLHFGYRCRLW